MTNRITHQDIESRISTTTPVKYSCGNGYLFATFRDQVALCFGVNNPEDCLTHTYMFEFKKNQRGDFLEALGKIANNKRNYIPIQTIVDCARILNEQLGSDHYDPRDNI